MRKTKCFAYFPTRLSNNNKVWLEYYYKTQKWDYVVHIDEYNEIFKQLD